MSQTAIDLHPICLRITKKDRRGAKLAEFFLKEGQNCEIGRESKHICLVDDSVSRKHCLLRLDGGILHVQDLHSRNGTFVSGRGIQKEKLLPGAKVNVGVFTLEVLTAPTGRWHENTRGGMTQAVNMDEIMGKIPEERADGTASIVLVDERSAPQEEIENLPGTPPLESPEKKEELPSEAGDEAPRISFQKASLQKGLEVFMGNPRTFFETYGYQPEISSALFVLALAGLTQGIAHSMAQPEATVRFFPLARMVTGAAGGLLWAWGFEKAKPWTEAQGSMGEYLTQAAFLQLFAFPIAVAVYLAPPLGGILNLALLGCWFMGFYWAFRPKPIPALLLAAGLGGGILFIHWLMVLGLAHI